jgi:hypothetical protein
MNCLIDFEVLFRKKKKNKHLNSCFRNLLDEHFNDILDPIFYNHLIIVRRNSILARPRSKCRHLNNLAYCFSIFPSSIEVNIVFFWLEV